MKSSPCQNLLKFRLKGRRKSTIDSQKCMMTRQKRTIDSQKCMNDMTNVYDDSRKCMMISHHLHAKNNAKTMKIAATSTMKAGFV